MFLSRHELCIHMNVDRAALNSGPLDCRRGHAVSVEGE